MHKVIADAQNNLKTNQINNLIHQK